MFNPIKLNILSCIFFLVVFLFFALLTINFKSYKLPKAQSPFETLSLSDSEIKKHPYLELLKKISVELNHYKNSHRQYPPASEWLTFELIRTTELALMKHGIRISLNESELLLITSSFDSTIKYKSTGANFKLIVERPVDCNEMMQEHPQLFSYYARCLNYGVWTYEAARWWVTPLEELTIKIQ